MQEENVQLRMMESLLLKLHTGTLYSSSSTALISVAYSVFNVVFKFNIVF